MMESIGAMRMWKNYGWLGVDLWNWCDIKGMYRFVGKTNVVWNMCENGLKMEKMEKKCEDWDTIVEERSDGIYRPHCKERF